MNSSPLERPWLQPTARVVTVGVLATGLVLGAARLDPVDPAASAGSDAARVAASSTTAYCPGDPFAGGGKDSPKVEIDGSVEAHAASNRVLAGVITPSDDPGRLSVRPLSTRPSSSADEKPGSGLMSASREDLSERPIVVRGTQERAPGLVAAQSFTADGGRRTGQGLGGPAVRSADGRCLAHRWGRREGPPGASRPVQPGRQRRNCATVGRSGRRSRTCRTPSWSPRTAAASSSSTPSVAPAHPRWCA